MEFDEKAFRQSFWNQRPKDIDIGGVYAECLLSARWGFSMAEKQFETVKGLMNKALELEHKQQAERDVKLRACLKEMKELLPYNDKQKNAYFRDLKKNRKYDSAVEAYYKVLVLLNKNEFVG